MGAFLLLVFVLASQVIGGFNTKLPPPAYGNSITILSIDGGGIKGIIPSVVLQRLEQILKVNATYLYLYVKMMHDYGVIFLDGHLCLNPLISTLNIGLLFISGYPRRKKFLNHFMKNELPKVY